MEPRVYTQHDRDQLLASFLDMSVNQIRERFRTVPDSEISDEINNLFGIYVSEMFSDNTDGQIMFQAVAMMSDSTLHRIVQLVGTDPL